MALEWSFQALLPFGTALYRSYCALIAPLSLYGPKLATDALHDKADWPLTARTFFTRPTLVILFHPPDPPIASQSITRDARFSQEHRLCKWSSQASLLPF